jgi:tRNA(Ile2)-agmatinylcytidine synthase
MWIGIDDTDSVKGGCTTYLIAELIKEFKEYQIIGYPRLVRLNPTLPWKTRGNGAVAIQFGRKAKVKREDKFPVAWLEGRLTFGYGDNKCEGVKADKFISKRVSKIVERLAWFKDPKTNPGFVIFNRLPSPAFYWRAVREVLKVEDAKAEIKRKNAFYRGYKNERGLIGATGSVSWEGKDFTFELITYREPKLWGEPRFIEAESVKQLDRECPQTFDNWDWKNKHNRIKPNSMGPVLYGIRGGDPKELIEGEELIKSELVNGWVIFKSNQATDDHLVRKPISKAKAYESAIIKGKVLKQPITIKGGHVIFAIEDKKGEIDCAAYEPTKEFRLVIRKLKAGDLVECYGSVKEKKGRLTLNLEKIKILKLVKVKEKVENPSCPRCKRHMHSIGKDKGYRCKRCRIKASEEAAILKEVPRKLKLGFYEVPVCARRHLAKPLKRMGITQMKSKV